MASQPTAVSVTAPLEPAMARVRTLLFRPFDLGRWFTIGFCAWLAGPGSTGWTGGGFNRHLPLGNIPAPDKSLTMEQELHRAHGWMTANLYWIVPVAIGVGLVLLVLGVLFLWLSSRGQFMFLHCVALNRGEVAAPWRRYAREAKSLFLFRLCLGLAALLPAAAVVGVFAYVIVRTSTKEPFGCGDTLGLFLAASLMLALIVAWGVVARLTRDFVVPIQFLRGSTTREAWRELLAAFSGRYHLWILYFLFQVVIGLAIAVLVLLALVVTCCLAGCLLAIPYLGTVLLLPVFVFQRAYSLYYLAQLGPQYDVFPPPVPYVPPSPAPAVGPAIG